MKGRGETPPFHPFSPTFSPHLSTLSRPCWFWYQITPTRPDETKERVSANYHSQLLVQLNPVHWISLEWSESQAPGDRQFVSPRRRREGVFVGEPPSFHYMLFLIVSLSLIIFLHHPPSRLSFHYAFQVSHDSSTLNPPLAVGNGAVINGDVINGDVVGGSCGGCMVNKRLWGRLWGGDGIEVWIGSCELG